jgi:hypothetical protein
MEHDETSRNGQSQTESALSAIQRLAILSKHLEDAR